MSINDEKSDLKVVDVCSGGSGGDSLSRAVGSLQGLGLPLQCVELSSEAMDGDERSFQDSLKHTVDADLVILRLHGGIPYFRKFHRFMESLPSDAQVIVKSEIPEEMGDYRHLLRFPDDAFRLLISYLKLGGEANEKALLIWAGRHLKGWDVDVPEPVRPRTEGLYHPDWPDDPIVDDYLKTLSPERPSVALMFYQGHWLSGSLEAIDAMIRALEEQGLNVIPVYYIASPDPVSGSLGARGTVERYLIRDGRPIVDLVVMTMGFSQIRLSDPGDGSPGDDLNFFTSLGVPVLQAGFTYASQQEWLDNQQGIGPFEMSGNVIWPEYDGQIIASPVGAMENDPQKGKELRPIGERVNAMAKAARRWAVLSRIPVNQRKVAIILYQNPPRRDSLGGAYGLDTPQSIVRILEGMRDHGYLIDEVPEDGNDLISRMLSGLANDEDWLSAREMRKRAAGVVKRDDYKGWLAKVPERNRTEMVRDWGEAPGSLFEVDGDLVMPGLVNGNILLAVQPARGMLEKADEVYHSEDLVIPHNYLAYYRWIRDVFKADAVVHMGTHGTLEWLPGKSLALCGECYPDIVLDDMVNVYPYLMSNPGEGMQAKRRSRAVLIGHLPPALTRAGGYDVLESLDNELQSYFHAVQGGSTSKGGQLLTRIHHMVKDAGLLCDLGLPEDVSTQGLEEHLQRLYDYLSEVKDSLIKDGLHVFGAPPPQERMDEMVYALTRLANGPVPSLRRSVAEAKGIDLVKAVSDPSAWSGTGRLNGELVEEVDRECMSLVMDLRSMDYDERRCIEHLAQVGLDSEDVISAVGFICSTLAPSILQAVDEVGNTLGALSGSYVPPGPSGVPSRGNAHLLPSGRNFYSLDPRAIPTPAAWEVGKGMAEQMVSRHIDENGCYPENVGMVVFATDTMKTGGDDIAYILWLMGLRPVWADDGGRVVDIEIIPLDELKRPRIDVTLRVSGLFRDAFPNLMDLIDRGVETIASLDESPENNYLCKHLKEDILESLKDGLGERESRSRALIRVFGCPPGTYGGGVSELIESSSWESVDDLADAFIAWGGYAYGGGRKGMEAKDVLRQRLSKVDVTVKNHSSRELDMLDNDDDYIYHGGMIAAVRSAKGEAPQSFVGDSSDPDNTKLRTAGEEGMFIFRSRVLNPKWLEGLKRHGYRGAQELSSVIDFSFAWDATAEIMEPWMYNSMAESFLLNDENREWVQENNPHALRHMSGKLLEAIDRGMWSPDDSMRNRLESMFLDAEDYLEDLED